MMIAANASTLFARLVAGAVTLMFFTYAFVNMGMVSGVSAGRRRAAAARVLRRHRAHLALHRPRLLMSVQAHRKLVNT
jgi:rod shape determining protein RodA